MAHHSNIAKINQVGILPTVTSDFSIANGNLDVTSSLNTGCFFLKRQVANTSTSINFTSGISNAYATYLVLIENLVASSVAQTELIVEVSTNGGASYIAGTSDSATKNMKNVVAASSFSVCGYSSSTGLAFLEVYLRLNSRPLAMADPSLHAASLARAATYYPATDTFNCDAFASCVAKVNAANSFNAVRFRFNSGAIAAGTFTLYGMDKN